MQLMYIFLLVVGVLLAVDRCVRVCVCVCVCGDLV